MMIPKAEKSEGTKPKLSENKSVDKTVPPVRQSQEHCPALLSFFIGEDEDAKIENLET